MRRRKASASLTDRQHEQIAAFLRDWLPAEAVFEYRRMMRDHPYDWWRDPHFANGVILEYALRGNGITERSLGVEDLTPLWPDLLASAIAEFEPN